LGKFCNFFDKAGLMMKKRRTWLILAGIVVIMVVVFVVVRQQQSARNIPANFQTVEIRRGDLTAIVGATGTVRANQTIILNWQTSGQIEQINAKAGDRVSQGFILATLAESSLPQSVILARSDLVSAQKTLDDLLNSDVARAKAYQALVQAQKELDDALTNRERKQYARSDQETLDIARANYIIAEDEVTKKERFYDQFSHLPEDNPMRAEAYSQLAKAKQNRNAALRNLNWLLGRPDPQEVAEADARVELARANLADAEREWSRLKDGPPAADIEAARARVAAIQATLKQAWLESPINGTVTEVRSKVGDQVSPGTVSFRIDDLSRLLVDVQVPEVDINRVQVGLPAALTFDAIQGRQYTGKVIEVARVGEVVQGVVNFTVTVELLDADESVRPGMTSAVNIIVNQLKDVILVPNRAVRFVEGKQTVFVLRNGKQEAVEVTIGASSDTYSEIVAGDLHEGDLAILNPVIQQAQQGPPFAR